MNFKQLKKKFKILFGTLRFDWKKLFLANTIDIRKDDDKTLKTKKFANAFFGGIFGIVAVLVAAYNAPHVKVMVSSFFLVVIAYIGFCAIMNALQIKLSNKGRKTKAIIGSFPELFYSPSDFETIDSYVTNHYSPENQMTSSDCHCILEIIIEKNLVRDKSLNPMVTLFVKHYPDLLPYKISNRAITKAKVYEDQQQRMDKEMFQNSSKK